MPPIRQKAGRFLAKLLALLFGVGISLVSAFLLIWRSWFCAQMARLNTLTQPTDINDYMMRRITQREVCGLGDHLASMIALFAGVIIAATAWTLLKERGDNFNERSEP